MDLGLWESAYWLQALFLRSKIILLLLGLCASVAMAHPHVFVDATVKVLFNEKGLSGVENRWVYDEVYSMATIASVDADGDGKLSAKESDALRPVVFGEASKANYFNYIQCGSEFLKVEKIRSFLDAVKNGTEAPVPTSQIIYNQAILDGIFKSAEAGREIEIEIPEI